MQAALRCFLLSDIDSHQKLSGFAVYFLYAYTTASFCFFPQTVVPNSLLLF
jgi:hypothetical protein